MDALSDRKINYAANLLRECYSKHLPPELVNGEVFERTVLTPDAILLACFDLFADTLTAIQDEASIKSLSDDQVNAIAHLFRLSSIRANKAFGWIFFVYPKGYAEGKVLPQGITLSTNTGISYTTLRPTTQLTTIDSEYDILVTSAECDEPGSVGNLHSNTELQLTSIHDPYLCSVYTSSMSKGCDAISKREILILFSRLLKTPANKHYEEKLKFIAQKHGVDLRVHVHSKDTAVFYTSYKYIHTPPKKYMLSMLPFFGNSSRCYKHVGGPILCILCASHYGKIYIPDEISYEISSSHDFPSFTGQNIINCPADTGNMIGVVGVYDHHAEDVFLLSRQCGIFSDTSNHYQALPSIPSLSATVFRDKDFYAKLLNCNGDEVSDKLKKLIGGLIIKNYGDQRSLHKRFQLELEEGNKVTCDVTLVHHFLYAKKRAGAYEIQASNSEVETDVQIPVGNILCVDYDRISILFNP